MFLIASIWLFVLPALRMLPSARMKRSGFASVSLADGHDLTVIVYCITCEPPTVLDECRR